MITRSSKAQWQGGLKDGRGTMKIGSGVWEGPYSFASRFESGNGTNPEELAGAAHAGCYSMAFSATLGANGFAPKSVSTTAKVNLEKVGDGFSVTSIDLVCEATVPGINDGKFKELAEAAKVNCPISKLFAGTKINLHAKLLSS